MGVSGTSGVRNGPVMQDNYGRGGGKRVTNGLDEMHGSKLPAENEIKPKRCKQAGERSVVGVGCRERVPDKKLYGP